jgi:site-specific recombinase XerD
MTTGDAVALFLSGYFGTNQRSAKTKSAYTIDLTQFRDFIGTESLLESVAPQNLEAWAAQLQAKPYGIASIRRKIASARVFFSYWVRRGTLSASPLWKLRFTLGRTRVLPRSLSAADSELLIHEAWRRYKITGTPQAKPSMAHVLASRDLAVVESLFATGMRVGELSKLNLPDWLSVDSSFLVHGKGGRERLSFLPDDRSVSALSAYLALRHKLGGTSEALFLNSGGQRLSEQGIALSLARIAEDAKIAKRVTPHMIRHTVATLLLRYGADLRIVQEVLGHASIATTQRYVHVAKDQLLTTLRSRHPNFHLRIGAECRA